jgi:hypothetical protein
MAMSIRRRLKAMAGQVGQRAARKGKNKVEGNLFLPCALRLAPYTL